MSCSGQLRIHIGGVGRSIRTTCTTWHVTIITHQGHIKEILQILRVVLVDGWTKSRIDGAPESSQGSGSNEKMSTRSRVKCLRKPFCAFPIVFSLSQLDPPPKPGSRSVSSSITLPPSSIVLLAGQSLLQLSVYEQTTFEFFFRFCFLSWKPG